MNSTRLERILEVLKYLAHHEAGCTLSHIAAELGFPVSSTHDLLQGLVEIDAARMTSPRTYTVGPRAVALGLAIADSVDLRRTARPLLEALSVDVRETVCLAIRSGADVIYAERYPDTSQSTSVVIALGERRPLHSSSAGKLIAAYNPELQEQAVEAARRGALERFTDYTLVDESALLAEFDQIRRQHYSLSDGEFVEGIRGLALPVVDADGAVVAAAQVVAPRSRLNDNDLGEIIARIGTATATISALIGASESVIPRADFPAGGA